MDLQERIEGSLIGCAIGSEFGWLRWTESERFEDARGRKIFEVKLEPNRSYEQHPNRINIWKPEPLIELGIRAYAKKGGRITPEDFAEELKEDKEISRGVFWWDALHTTQELLREGMNPRISGLGTAPNGLVSASMPAVGIYHFADPEHAYLDGVEIASVCQPRTGADWAGLSAAAVACAFSKTPEEIVENVLKIALENNKDLFYQLNFAVRSFSKINQDEEILNAWFNKISAQKDFNWIDNNPIKYVLPLLVPFSMKPQKMMSLLLCMEKPNAVSPVIAGAVAGALYGRDVFPAEWLKWAGPVAEKWSGMTKVVESRKRKEKTIISVCGKLAKREKEAGLSLLEEKIYGCLLAGAIGNAMGSPVEGKLYTEIDREYPGGIKTILDPGRLESEDDNQMAMLLVETYMDRGGRPVMARHFGEKWREKLNRDHFYSLCMGNTYDLIMQGWDPRITGHWNVVTGSTVMCMEPAGLYNAVDPEFCAIDATAISCMYQRGLDVPAAAVLACCVSEALFPDATVDSICKAALKYSPRCPLKTFDKRPFKSVYDYLEKCLEISDRYDDVLAMREELYKKCLLYHHIDPLEVLGFSLAMFRTAKGDVRLSAIGGTNIGRDSDTIAGRASMLAGTLRGYSNVPGEWMEMFGRESLARIRNNSKRISDLLVNRKLAVLKQRSQLP